MTTTTDHRAAIWWPGWISEGLCVLGLAVSTYLTYEHFNDPGGLACPATGIVNCAKVVTSSYSVVLGVPVPVAGLAYFAAMAVLCSPPAWRSPRPALRRLRLVASLTGAVMIVWLIYVELFRLDAICLWCTSSPWCCSSPWPTARP